ncbi:MAG: leucyl aminopeptidase [Pseudomonadota bacterium]
MEFSIKTTAPEKCPCVVVGVYEDGKLSDAAQALDRAAKRHLSALVKRGDLTGKLGSTLLLHDLPGTPCERVLLVGLGKQGNLEDKPYREAVRCAVRALNETGATEATLFLPELPVKQRNNAWNVTQAVLVAEEVLYRFDQLKSKKEENRRPLRKLHLNVAKADSKTAQQALLHAQATAAGTKLAKNLGNLPGNICTPSYLAEQARALAKNHAIKVQVLERKDMEKLGMGSFLSVTRGSHEPPKLIVLQYHGGGKKQKPVALVGKGITFDTGGISLKPGAEMDEMKYDMCGAASVLGTFQAAAAMKLPLNLVGIIPTCENMPGGSASKPGDIVKSMSGQTIEILNTDAEGRLILCDALTYAARFEPDVVIDIATLTGACVIALGHVASGLLSNDDRLADELLDAGNVSYDRAWRLPLWDDYQEQLRSPFADMANIGGRPAGTITAACFLARFTKQYRWAHLDIAGTAWRSGKEKGGTGRPVPLLSQFLIARAGSKS